MPLYDYACKDCGHTFERNLKMADRHLPISEGCPECGQIYSKNGKFEAAVYIHVGTSNIAYSLTHRRTDDDFNSKLKQLRDRVPAEYKANLERNIR